MRLGHAYSQSEIAGFDQGANSSVVIRSRLRVMPLEQSRVRREYPRRLKCLI